MLPASSDAPWANVSTVVAAYAALSPLRATEPA
jgi:hypothetical protein